MAPSFVAIFADFVAAAQETPPPETKELKGRLEFLKHLGVVSEAGAARRRLDFLKNRPAQRTQVPPRRMIVIIMIGMLGPRFRAADHTVRTLESRQAQANGAVTSRRKQRARRSCGLKRCLIEMPN